jgi:hypothetical protein
MQPIKLKEAGISDINSIAALAKLIWNQHYPSIIGQAQIDYMLGKMYDKYSLKEQILIKKHRFYLIEFEGKAIGFISIYEESQPNGSLLSFTSIKRLQEKVWGLLYLKRFCP